MTYLSVPVESEKDLEKLHQEIEQILQNVFTMMRLYRKKTKVTVILRKNKIKNVTSGGTRVHEFCYADRTIT